MRALALGAASPPPPHRRPEPLSCVLRWGVPHWQAAQLASPDFRAQWRPEVRRSLRLPANATLALSLGYFNPLKGYPGIYRAVLAARGPRGCPAEAASLHLVLAGAGGHRLARWLGGDPALTATLAGDARVHVLPPVQPERFLVAADVYISNALHGGESWGLATLEAAAAGLVLLASANGGTLEQATHNATALLHSPARAANVPQLARHLCAVLRDPGLAARLAAEGRRRALDRFGPATTQASLAALLRQLAARTAAAADSERARDGAAAAVAGAAAAGEDGSVGAGTRAKDVVVAAAVAAPPPAVGTRAGGGAGDSLTGGTQLPLLLPPLQLLPPQAPAALPHAPLPQTPPPPPPRVTGASGDAAPPSDAALALLAPPGDAAAVAAHILAAVLPARRVQQCRRVAARLAAAEERRVARAPRDELRYFTSPASRRLFHGDSLYAPPSTVAHVFVPAEPDDSAGGVDGAGSYVVLAGSNTTARLGAPPAWGAGQRRQQQHAAAVTAVVAIPATARHLLIVCHPDDELIFFGRPLLTAPPATWAVVVVTMDGVRSLAALCPRLRLAACVHLPHADAFSGVLDTRLVAELARLLAAHPWATVATHGALGEYGHPQHVALHAAVRALATALVASTGGRLRLATPAKADAAASSGRGEDAEPLTAALNRARVAAVAALYPTIDTQLYAQMVAEHQALEHVVLERSSSSSGGGGGSGGPPSSSAPLGGPPPAAERAPAFAAAAAAPRAALGRELLCADVEPTSSS